MHRLIVPALMTAALVAGCGKKDKDKAPADPGSGSAKADPTPPPSPPTPPPAGSAGSGSAAPAAGGDLALPTGTPVKLGDLAKIDIPKPAKAPASGRWQDVGDQEADGRRFLNFMDGDTLWYTVQLFDCRMPDVKAYAAKKPDERGDYMWCFMHPTGKLKDFDQMTQTGGGDRAVRAGNFVVIGGIGAKVKDKTNDADLDTLLSSIDLAALSKL